MDLKRELKKWKLSFIPFFTDEYLAFLSGWFFFILIYFFISLHSSIIWCKKYLDTWNFKCVCVRTHLCAHACVHMQRWRGYILYTVVYHPYFALSEATSSRLTQISLCFASLVYGPYINCCQSAETSTNVTEVRYQVVASSLKADFWKHSWRSIRLKFLMPAVC